MREAFHLADPDDDHVIDDVISGYTGLFPCNWGSIKTDHEERGYYLDGKLWFFSSCARNEVGAQKKTGTRWIDADTLLRTPERWKLYLSTAQPKRRPDT